jgi:hypothetical protein
MDLASVLVELSRRKLLVALAIIPAVVVGIALAYDISTSPLGLHDKSFQAGAASVDFLVDSNPSSLGFIPQPDRVRKNKPTQITPSDPLVTRALITRAQALARVASSDQILDGVSKRTKIPREQLTASAPRDPQQASAGAQTTVEQRADELVQEGAPYRILMTDSQVSPTVSIFVQAPNAALAQRVAQATVASLRSYVRLVGRSAGTTARNKIEGNVRVVQLGRIDGGTVAQTPNRAIAIVAALLTFIVLCVLIALTSRTLRRVRTANAMSQMNGAPAVHRKDAREHREPVSSGTD